MGRPDRSRNRLRFLRNLMQVAAIVAACMAGASTPLATSLSTWAFDTVLLGAPEPASTGILVVDIDEASLRENGPWPWPRQRLADLIGRIAKAGPKLIALDILLARQMDNCGTQAPAGAAGSGTAPAAPVGDTDREADRRVSPDRADGCHRGQDALRLALATTPSVVAALLDIDTVGGPNVATPIVVAPPQPSLRPWAAAGIDMPSDGILEAASGVGVASLAGGTDGIVRTVPLLAVGGDSVLPGLAVEIVRVSQQASAIILGGGPNQMQIGALMIPLSADAELRFYPATAAEQAARTVPAAEVLSGAVADDLLKGKIVLVGGSAAELGALRETARGPLVPSVQIHADAVATMLAGKAPFRPGFAPMLERLGLLAMCAVVCWIGITAPPVTALSVAALLAAAWLGTAVSAFAYGRFLIDPAVPVASVAAAIVCATITGAVRARRAARRLRQRFEQRLPPEVVQRIVENIDTLKLEGERREVTAMFTDIEDFTATTERVAPEILVEMLDRYFAGVTAIVIAHGGMVDKIVGDAVHALFNAPFDLDGHAGRAIDCAFEIVAFSDAFRGRPEIARHGLGRTRIGIETGPVVLGDVGYGAKIDYTAHGSAVNTAARLESINKQFGTSICAGPAARNRAAKHDFRSLGTVEVRGRGPLEVFEPKAAPPPTGSVAPGNDAQGLIASHFHL